MDPAFCVDTLEVLPPKHLLVRKETEPEKIAELIEEKPVQLVVEALAVLSQQGHDRDRPRDHAAAGGRRGEVQEMVVRRPRKAVAKDPRIAVPEKKTECYVLRETPVSAEDEILEQFNTTRSARRRIQLAEELAAAAGRKEAKTDLMPTSSRAWPTASRTATSSTPSERLYGAAVRDELAKIAGVDLGHVRADAGRARRQRPATCRPSPRRSPSSSRAHFLELIKETHPDRVPRHRLQPAQGVARASSRPSASISSSRTATPTTWPSTLKRWQTEQNLRAPVLLWIVKNRHSKKFAKLLNDLITPRLLSAIFFAIDYEALQAAERAPHPARPTS